MNSILRHQWLSFRRSPAFEKDLGIKIFLAILGLLVLVNLIFLSSNLNETLQALGVDSEPTQLVNQFLLYYFISELALRYIMQTVPVLDIEPYLHLPIRKKLITRFLVIKSIFNPYNLIAPAIFIPLAITTFIPEIGIEKSIVWLAFTLLLSLSLHFFNILMKKKLENNMMVWLVLAALVVLNYIGNRYMSFELIPLGTWATAVYNMPILLLIPVTLLSFLIYISVQFFYQNLYLEDLFDAKMMSGEKFTSRLSNWENKGLMNTLIVQELKLILRHKRSRSSVMLAGIFLFYPLLIFSMGEEAQSKAMAIFVSVFFTGIFIIQYGQFLWSWNTNQMDFFLTKINPYTYWVESRYRLLIYSVLITSVLSLPYFYFGYEVMLIMGATALYNVGINSMLIMRMSLWGAKPIELNKSAMMNYQGVGAAQFVVGIPLILGPIAVYTPFSLLWNNHIGILAIAIAGLIGLIFRKAFFNAIAKKLKKDKYKLIHDLTI
ncbi:hypothetical protein MATR_04940 [Marivirga tractuosa]|uniref:Uncharacterized protein n=1 Tax=Marivirga tractuosa (strain ATCC 23168 / DSM 4126 / NBRC 15989 / NCIMB 1408 / VKM B-1430 / H-43) TaxID=643867 RepID=E4TSR3_MARTH|nr:DUF5687 family protein [Marivirga tractuosa]ADR21873.1 hypothetical protein Ftrac_1886 [Marivirga tractuosa DSM 4126]BDD13669.1 hypothetical protein MATR_04940 [Marivirga tractuosa]